MAFCCLFTYLDCQQGKRIVTMTTLFSKNSPMYPICINLEWSLLLNGNSDKALFSSTVFSTSEALLTAKENGSQMDTYTELSKIMSPVPSVCQTSIRYEYSTRYFYFVSTCQAFLLWIQLDWTKSKVTFGNLSFLQILSNIIKSDFKVGDKMRDFRTYDSNQNIERLSWMELNWKNIW